MSDQEFQIAVIAIVFGSAVAVAFLITIGTVINSWIKRKSGSNLANNEDFLEALRQFKKKTDKRLSNLEMIVSDEKAGSSPKITSKLSDKKNTLEIEDKGSDDAAEEKTGGGNLRNMLKE